MSAEEKSIDVTISTVRWLVGGGLAILFTIIKLEMNRIWRSIEANAEETKILSGKTSPVLAANKILENYFKIQE